MEGNEGNDRTGADSGIKLPVIVGLVLGVAFIISFAYFISAPLRIRTFSDTPPIEEEFKNIEQLPEVKLFLEKYGNDPNTIKGFGRSLNGTIQFSYTAAAFVDKDGDGYKEANRRLDLTISYDESGGKWIYLSFDAARVKQVEIRCRELTKMTADVDKAFIDIMTPAYEGQVKDFIVNAKCLF